MPLPEEFYRKLQTRSTESVIEMAANPAAYEPEAVEAAKSELRRRALPEEKITSMSNLVQQAVKVDNERANEPLEWGMRILSLIMLFPSMTLYQSYMKEGQIRKANECMKWSLSGLTFYTLLGLALKFFGYTPRLSE